MYFQSMFDFKSLIHHFGAPSLATPPRPLPCPNGPRNLRSEDPTSPQPLSHVETPLLNTKNACQLTVLGFQMVPVSFSCIFCHGSICSPPVLGKQAYPQDDRETEPRTVGSVFLNRTASKIQEPREPRNRTVRTVTKTEPG